LLLMSSSVMNGVVICYFFLVVLVWILPGPTDGLQNLFEYYIILEGCVIVSGVIHHRQLNSDSESGPIREIFGNLIFLLGRPLLRSEFYSPSRQSLRPEPRPLPGNRGSGEEKCRSPFLVVINCPGIHLSIFQPGVEHLVDDLQ
jgi:hypothetical protein